MRHPLKSLIIAIIVLVTSCAIVKTPTGGPRDEAAPEVLYTSPENGTIHFNAKKIHIEFNEYINLVNAYKEITFSPEIEPAPEVKGRLKSVEIKLHDSLRANTTYNINFGNSITDVTESNALKNYKYLFSTGDFIDSMRVKGRVVYVVDTNQVKDVIVALYPTERELFFGKKPIIYSNTNEQGEFEIENVKEGNYQIYAFKDLNSNKQFDEDELLAFLSDSIALYQETQPLENIVLTLSKQVPEKLRIADKRYYEGRISIKLNYPEDSLYFNVLEPTEFKDKIKIDRVKSDTLNIWLPTYNFDSTKIQVQNNKGWTDTILVMNFTKEPKMAKLKVEDNVKHMLRPKSDFKLLFSRPLSVMDTSKISLLEDSVAIRNFEIIPNPDNLREYVFKYQWDTTKKYIIDINANQLKDIYGNTNEEYKKTFTVDSAANYGTVTLEFKIPKGKQYIAQILTSNNVLLKEMLITESKDYQFEMVPPEKYRIRYIEDTNKNGKWDIGNVRENIQPEPVVYYKDLIVVRKDWDITIVIKPNK